MKKKAINSALAAFVVMALVSACASVENSPKPKGSKISAKEIPFLKAPKASCTKVPERIEGDQFIGSHILCTIEKPAVWSK